MSEDNSTNVFLISGDDEPQIAAHAHKVVRRLAGDDPDPFSLDIVRERDGVPPGETINEVIRSIQSPPFLGNRKTVWLQNFRSFKAEGTASAKTADARAFRDLATHIATGIPADIALVISGPGVDARKALATACNKHGTLTRFGKPDVKDRNWESAMRQAIESRAADKGLSLEPAVCDFLVSALGADTGRIDGELEKLICYCGGPGMPVSLDDAETVIASLGEEVSWALNNAIGRRDAADALRIVNVLMQQSKDDERTARSLLAQAAGFIRDLLQVKVFMATHKVAHPRGIRKVLEALTSDDKQTLRERGMRCVDFHWYRATILAEQAARYGGHELITAVRAFRDAYWKCISSSVPNRVALEDVLLRVIGVSP